MYQMESPPNARAIINGKEVDYFGGTGYLTFHHHPDIIKAACEATQKYGVGTATSRAGYGNSPVLLEVEERAAAFFQSERAVYYVSGYLGNAILLQSQAPKYDIIFADAESHSSISNGALMANKPVVSFAHCDAEDLEDKLRATLKPSQRPLVICDGVFPATGVVSPLQDYVTALNAYDQPLLCVDDAHASGILGEHGTGSLEYCGVQGEGRYTSHTMSKALGGHGGIITGTNAFIESLTHGSKIPYGSSSVPAPAAAATAKALEILSKHPEIRQQLWRNVAYAKNALRNIGVQDIPDNPVPIISIRSNKTDLNLLQQRLFEKGIAVLYSPGGSYSGVAPEGQLRIAIFSSHSTEQIDRLVTELAALL